MVEYHGFDSVSAASDLMPNGQSVALYSYNFFHNRNSAAAPSFWARYFAPTFLSSPISPDPPSVDR